MGTYTGTAGNDTITRSTVSAGVTANPPGSRPSAADDVIDGRGGDDYLAGGGGNDRLYGGAGNDFLEVMLQSFGIGGPAWLYGGEGNDTLNGYIFFPAPFEGTPETRQFGGAGDDSLSGSQEDHNGAYFAVDTLVGGTGNDTYHDVSSVGDVIIEQPGEGVDTVITERGITLPDNVENLTLVRIVDPPYFDQTASGNNLANTIIGATDDNTFYGEGGDDTIFGGGVAYWAEPWMAISDEDTIYGGDGNDTIHGGDGVTSADGADTLYGEAGNDTIHAQAGDDVASGGDGNDALYGGGGNDQLAGDAGNDVLWGNSGVDTLRGGLGNDALHGEGGNDHLTGGFGADRLSGGFGNDVYDYNALDDSSPAVPGRDVILDFTGIGKPGGDVIDLSTLDARTGAAGNQSFTFRGTDAITGAGQVNVVETAGATLIQINVNAGLAPEMVILVQEGAVKAGAWSAGEFFL
jgi:Ca2+-binding RTX toxin-like protein